MKSNTITKLMITCICMFGLVFADNMMESYRDYVRAQIEQGMIKSDILSEVDYMKAQTEQSGFMTEEEMLIVSKEAYYAEERVKAAQLALEKEAFYAIEANQAPITSSPGSNGSRESCLDGEVEVTFALEDSYGDSWNGGFITFGDATYTVSSSDNGGDWANHLACVADNANYSYSYTAGSYAYENSWTVEESDGTILSSGSGSSGTADYSFNVGGPPPVPGCTDADAPEYNSDATVDDGSCWAACIAGG
ncbi:MAG: hypothetical protein QF704_17440, partial [Anaerolineales bacterium]|nr:hypothetical protein [Anaerolineales bacterium]